MWEALRQGLGLKTWQRQLTTCQGLDDNHDNVLALMKWRKLQGLDDDAGPVQGVLTAPG